MKLHTFAAFSLILAITGGCSTHYQSGERLEEEPNFQLGYGDGCATGSDEQKSFSTKKTRDAYLFDNDRAYAAGWRQGYLSCGSKNLDNRTDGGLILGDEAAF